jgi:hypothetical protein
MPISLSTTVPTDLSVLLNEENQALIFPVDKWPNGLPSLLRFKASDEVIEAYDHEGDMVGVIPYSAENMLMSAGSYYVAAPVQGVLKHHTEISTVWEG